MLKKLILCLLFAFSIILYAQAGSHTYDEAVSLGSGCQIAFQMEANGIRKVAYPFDWFTTPFDSLIAFIDRKGANFLDYDKINVIGPYPGSPDTLFVLDLVYGIHSYHDFLSTPPLGNYQQVKAKYDRRIKRFFDLLKSNKKVLFIREGVSRSQIEYLDYLLHTSYPNLSYTILAVHQDEEYRNNWGLKRIRNFYLQQTPGNWMGDGARWKEILSQFSVTPLLTPRDPNEMW